MNDNCNCKSNMCSCKPRVVAIQTTAELERFADTVVYVVSTNTTYYVSGAHEITIISAGPVFVSNYNPKTNVLGLANQVCYDFANNVAYAFDAGGNYRTFNLEEAA